MRKGIMSAFPSPEILFRISRFLIRQFSKNREVTIFSPSF